MELPVRSRRGDEAGERRRRLPGIRTEEEGPPPRSRVASPVSSASALLLPLPSYTHAVRRAGRRHRPAGAWGDEGEQPASGGVIWSLISSRRLAKRCWGPRCPASGLPWRRMMSLSLKSEPAMPAGGCYVGLVSFTCLPAAARRAKIFGLPGQAGLLGHACTVRCRCIGSCRCTWPAGRSVPFCFGRQDETAVRVFS